MEIGKDLGGGAEHHAVASLKGGVGDVFRDHRFPQTVGTHQDEIASFGNEVQCQGALDDGTVDFLGPVPLEVGDGFEAADMRALEAAFEGTTRRS